MSHLLYHQFAKIGKVFYKILCRFVKKTDCTKKSARWVCIFPDDSPGAWYYSDAAYLESLGVAQGCDDGNFHGGNLITRAEVVTIVNRMLGREPDKAFIRANADSLNQFSDLLDPHHWAFYDFAEAANTHSLVSGSASETWHTAE